MAYNIRSEEYQHFRDIERRRPDAHRSIGSSTDHLSDDQYHQLTSRHHEDEQYSDYSFVRRRRHTAAYRRRFTINPHQSFITVRRTNGALTLEVLGEIHHDDEDELNSNLAIMPPNVTLTVTEAFEKIDALAQKG